MRRFTRALAAIFSMVVLGSLVLLIPQKKVSAQGGGPTVAIGGPLPLPVAGTVNISNPLDASGNPVPLAATVVDGPARRPFQSFVCTAFASVNGPIGGCRSAPGFVPSGKLLVVEQVLGGCNVPVGSSLSLYKVTAGAAGIGEISFEIAPTLVGSFDGVFNGYVVNQPTKLYVGTDSGSLSISFGVSDFSGRSFCFLNVSGYLE